MIFNVINKYLICFEGQGEPLFMHRPTEEKIRREIYKNGPVSSGIKASNNFQNFNGSGEFSDVSMNIERNLKISL